METTIITKFTIATEKGIHDLLFLTETIARERFAKKISNEELESYISKNFNKAH